MLSRLRALAWREWAGAVRSPLLLILLILLPISFGLLFGTFTQIFPKGAPSMVVAGEGASEADAKFAFELIAFFSSPSRAQRVEEARLYREEAYFILLVPPGLREGSGSARVFVDASSTPIVDLAPVVVGSIRDSLRSFGVTGLGIEVAEVGRSVLPFEYFAPGLVVLLCGIIAFLVLPHAAAKDAAVVKRVLASASPGEVIAGKLAFAVALAALQVALLMLVQKAAGVADESLLALNAWSAAVILASVLGFSSLSLAITFATKYSEAGKQANALLLAFLAVFSGVFYPVGFLPLLPGLGGILQSIARALPSYYAVVLLRSFGVRRLGVELYWDYLAYLAAFALVCLAACHYFAKRLKNG